MKKGQLLGVTIFAALICGLLWITSDVYIMALHIPNEIAAFIHACVIFFALLFIFSWFSGVLQWGNHLQVLYRFCNIMFGIFFYIFLGSVVISVVSFFYSSTILALGVALLAILAGIAGLLQARQITTTSYEILLHGAPYSWEGKRAVFLSDTHFGLMNHENFSDKIVEKVLSLSPDLVLHGGDFYDGPAITTNPITASWKKITERVPVFYTSGNHEHYGPYDSFIASIRDAGATVLLNDKVIHDGVQIAGITYLPKGADAKAQEVIAKLALDTKIPTILINHPPTFHAAAHRAGVSLMLSGHTHRGQFSPLGPITRLIYGKYNYGINSADTLIAITSRGVGTAGPPMRLFNTPELVVLTFRTK